MKKWFGSAAVCINEDKEVLMVKSINAETWAIPSGGIEEGETPEECCIREVKEETGIKIEKLELLDVFSGPEYFLKFSNGDELYSVTAVCLTYETKGNIEIDYAESIDFQYYNINELPEGLNEVNRNYIKPYLKKLPRNPC